MKIGLLGSGAVEKTLGAGLIKHRHDESLIDCLQRELTTVRFVKAFNSVDHASMVDPKFMGGEPTMFICGNDEAAKEMGVSLIEEDMDRRGRHAALC